MNKRGLSHIEMLLSFLIFVGFVIFAFYFFSPFKTSRIIETTLDYAEREIIKNTSVELEKYEIKINNIEGISEPILKIKLENIDNNKKLCAENKNGASIPAKREGASGNVKFKKTDAIEGIVILKFAEGLIENENIGVGDEKMLVDYNIISDKINIVSKARILELIERYNADYAGLKIKFNLPSQANFEFALGDIMPAKRERQSDAEVFSDIKRIEVLEDDGKIKFYELIVRVW